MKFSDTVHINIDVSILPEDTILKAVYLPKHVLKSIRKVCY